MNEIILEVFVYSFQTTKSKDESYFNKTSLTPVVKPGSKVMSAEYVLYRVLDQLHISVQEVSGGMQEHV